MAVVRGSAPLLAALQYLRSRTYVQYGPTCRTGWPRFATLEAAAQALADVVAGTPRDALVALRAERDDRDVHVRHDHARAQPGRRGTDCPFCPFLDAEGGDVP
jgi:hypothetical protein